MYIHSSKYYSTQHAVKTRYIFAWNLQGIDFYVFVTETRRERPSKEQERMFLCNTDLWSLLTFITRVSWSSFLSHDTWACPYTEASVSTRRFYSATVYPSLFINACCRVRIEIAKRRILIYATRHGEANNQYCRNIGIHITLDANGLLSGSGCKFPPFC